jgi:predicted O-methyltransferase YrrM
MTPLASPTVADYQAAFDAERVKDYPVVDAFEARMGFALDRERLESAARVLACPLKNNPPNWQHGRVLYAAARARFSRLTETTCTVLDIGTAKGFSALCLLWAAMDAGIVAAVASVDVIDPDAKVGRNTVAEVGGLKTLRQTLHPWPESDAIAFQCMTGVDWLKGTSGRVEVAFIDGKHTGEVVAREARLLAVRQRPGDLAIFDDVHLPDIAKAVEGVSDLYELETLRILPNRAYAIGVRRG